MALGHFKKQCTQIKETCRTCGNQVDDMKNHRCSKVEKCVHCEQNRKCSSLKCQVVKSFRAELTRKIFQVNNRSSSDSRLLNKNVIFNSTNFPPLPVPKSSTLLLNPMMVKLDELINKLSEVKDRLDNFEAKHDKFEQFIFDKNRYDETVIKNMNDVYNNYMILKKDVVQQNLFIERHENLFFKLLIPMLEDVLTFISSQNQNQKGNPLDADFKCRINRYFIQIKKATEGENKNGGVLVLVRLYIQATRIECKLHNVCVLDIKGEEILRIIGVYAPNIQDGKRAEIFLAWIDTNFLVPFTPESSTSLRSNRVIDFALAAGLIKPHPYTDSPFIDYDNVDEPIPEVKLDELELTVQTKRHWSLFLKLFNHSFQTAIMPKAWKDTRMVLLAKNEPICSPSLTRPISLIDSFLKMDRRCFIDINGNISRWFSIEKDDPQGSVLTPTVFISYHNDMGQFLSECTSHFFADDVAAIFSGQLEVRYTSQCIDLERRVESFLDSLEYYSCLADQHLNRTKTEAMFSARAIGSPKFNIMFDSGDGNRICWRPEYKYLGYIISSRLGWVKLLKNVQCKIRKRISLIKSFKLFGCSFPSLRKTLFYSHILPLFTWTIAAAHIGIVTLELYLIQLMEI
ncbi:unnamed protein product [Rotaria socialis]|uniref:Reverse transcriptase domain-containing protein n=1 Tax=Rotaria socialis TaxID=392032 RepID=A0A821K7S9_9BILA|nr:unnamed protein product [Rotaria socialis]